MRGVAAEAVRHVKRLRDSYKLSVRPLVVREEDVTCVYLKGSDSLYDWVQDLDADLVSFPGTSARVHEGFLQVFRDCYDRHLLLDPDSTDTVVIAGHSLGGALAQMYALALGNDFIRANIIVHSFGAPRCGDSWFSYLYNCRVPDSYRWVVDKDPIPCLPAWGYQHTQGRIHLTNEGLEVGSLGSFTRRLRYWLGFRPRDFADHGLEAYERSIRAWGGI